VPHRLCVDLVRSSAMAQPTWRRLSSRPGDHRNLTDRHDRSSDQAASAPGGATVGWPDADEQAAG
jgi:hypothetical protein